MTPLQTSPVSPPGDPIPALVAAVPVGDPPALSAPPGMDTVVHVLRRRWLLILVSCTLAATLAAAATWLIIPGRYSAQMILEVRGRAGHAEEEAGAAQRAQAFALKDPKVLNGALDRETLAPLYAGQSRQELANWLQKDLVVDFPAGLDVTRVTLTGDRPEQLAPILDAVAAAFQEKCAERDQVRATERVEQLNKQFQATSEELRRKRNLLHETEMRVGFKSPTTVASERENILRALENANRDRRTFQPQLRKAITEWCDALVQLETPETVVVDPSEVELMFRGDPTALATINELVQAERVLQRNVHVSGSKEGDVGTQAQKNVDALKSQLNLYRTRISPDLEKLLRQTRVAELRKNLDHLESQASQAHAQDDALAAVVKQLEKDLKDLAENSRTEGKNLAELYQLADEVQTGENTQKRINDEIAATRLAPIAYPRLVLEEPATPTSARNDRRLKFTLAAAGGAFGLVFLAVALVEFRARRVYAPVDVTRGLGLPLLGTLPAVGSAARRPLADDATTVSSEQGALLEAVDAVRTMILYAGRTRPLRVVMVTSAGMGEGKSTLALQLAASLARSWRRVLLVDGDLRHPSAHEQCGLAGAPGLCEVLRGEIHADEAIQATKLNRLSLLPAGRCDRHALEALAQESLGEVFAGFKEIYDFVILDVSPVLPVSDALQFGQHVDGVLLSVLRDVTRLPDLWAARQRLAGLNVPVLGAVVIGGPTSVYGGLNPVPLRLNG
jgi:succinoglycan biosynthesis transport protein ExoP